MPESFENIFLLGYSGHALVVAEAAIMIGLKINGYAERQMADNNPFQLSYIGFEQAPDFDEWRKNNVFILGIGDNRIRSKLAQLVRTKGCQCLTLIHPESKVSSYTKIGEGTFVARNAAINPFCQIGTNAIINTSASIDHECQIGNGTHIAPGAVLAGGVTIGSCSFIGANAVIKEGITIGDNVIIGAGAVVVKDVKNDLKIVGNPAKIIGDAK